MSQLSGVGSRVRAEALAIKILVAGVGFATLIISLSYIVNEFVEVGSIGAPRFIDIVMVVTTIGALLSGVMLIVSLPSSLRIKFPRRTKRDSNKPVYGFATVVAIGTGATLGSPLFILIPLNVVQYEFVSFGSLFLASLLSILMARVYANMYKETKIKGLDALGGPSFTRVACGRRSLRYFVSRLSMWLANTALAAYTKIVFIVFDFELMPGILAGFGITGIVAQAVVWLITAIFVGWTMLDALFERRLLKITGYLQIVLTSVMILILVEQSFLLGSKGSWQYSGLFQFTAGGNWIEALIVNTGYLYLLFFGFQEIQALEHDTFEYSSIPVISWIKNYRMSKTSYLGLAMILSVAIAAVVNIFYGFAVFSIHPDLAQLQASKIPALFLASRYLGNIQELLIAIAFLLASITTFVPAFLAASRHLSALGEDGFMPQSASKFSFGFTLVAIFILAVGNQDFLVEITDFLVLISLGIISLSAIWLEKNWTALGGRAVLPIVVGFSSLIAGASVYVISPSVAIFGWLAIVVAYLIYDIYELGSAGAQIFLAIFNIIAFAVLALYPHDFASQGFFLFQWLGIPELGSASLGLVLLTTSVLLFANFIFDLRLQSLTRKANARLARLNTRL